MKFKVLKSNDFDYDSKDKHFYSSWRLSVLRRRVGKNPKRMTFDPFEVYLQDCYATWLSERRFWLFEKVIFPALVIAFILIVIAGYKTGAFYEI
tara:strand:+ start:904 stop:1185 length:282 start_codon:yes stop_codon:yes gene_type:complete